MRKKELLSGVDHLVDRRDIGHLPAVLLKPFENRDGGVKGLVRDIVDVEPTPVGALATLELPDHLVDAVVPDTEVGDDRENKTCDTEVYGIGRPPEDDYAIDPAALVDEQSGALPGCLVFGVQAQSPEQEEGVGSRGPLG